MCHSYSLNDVVIELPFHGEICAMIKWAHHTLNDDAHQTTYSYQEIHYDTINMHSEPTG